MELDRLLAPLELGGPADDAEIDAIVADVAGTFGAPLPDDYVAFLRLANGADGALANGRPLVLYASELLWTENADADSGDWLADFFAIGSDAGDAVYGLDLREDAPDERYLETDDVGMDWDYVFWRGASLLDLLRHLGRDD